MRTFFGILAAGLALAAACGGKAVIDGDNRADGGAGAGASGAGGSTSTTSSMGGSTTTTASGTSCSDLHQRLDDAIAEAIRCAAVKPVVQCDGSAFVLDACGCQVLANEHNREAIEHALDVYEEVEAAGCGLDCRTCRPFSGGVCVTGPQGDVCVPADG